MIDQTDYLMLTTENERRQDESFKKILKHKWESLKTFCTKRKTTSEKDELSLKFEIKENVVLSNSKKPSNAYCSQKYSLLTFIPLVLINQFRVFYNFYFLLISIANLMPFVVIGSIWTCWLPMLFFLAVSFVKEGLSDYERRKRDNEANNQVYEKISNGEMQKVCCRDIRVGDLVVVHSGQRVPADMILLSTREQNNGTIFIKTDQLDGETDWKLRNATNLFRGKNWKALLNTREKILIKLSEPRKDIYEFSGVTQQGLKTEELGLQNTLWANTVVASGTAVGLVVYTGKDTKRVLNSSKSSFKTSVFEYEANRFAKVLFLLQLMLGASLTFATGFSSTWYVRLLSFLILFSYMIPISLRINLEMARTFYSYLISTDTEIKETIVRNTNACEELGTLSYLLTDKTGTLTLNEMKFKKIKTENKTYSEEKVASICESESDLNTKNKNLKNLLMAVSLCHNVTPTQSESGEDMFQGSSTDELALLDFAKKVGFRLVERYQDEIVIRVPFQEGLKRYQILRVLPFTSALKRMGIVLQNKDTDEVVFLCKGAEEILSEMVRYCPWLKEEAASLATEGLRTLVFATKTLSKEAYLAFEAEYNSVLTRDENQHGERRDTVLQGVIARHLENNLEALGVTGVEDKLREEVRITFELVKLAGIRIWMLTGDKFETAVCVGKATGMVTKRTRLFKIDFSALDQNINTLEDDLDNTVLVVENKDLQDCLNSRAEDFMKLATSVDGLILCRLSPTQKAETVRLLQKHTGQRVCAVGDGGNDVGMIQVSDVGVGIEGKEGRSASLAADVATSEFKHISRLLLWHGRNAYLQSTTLANLIFHRGAIIAIMQAIFSVKMGFSAESIFNTWLLFAYAAVLTSMPLFSLVLNHDMTEQNIFLFPFFYDHLKKEDSFSYKLFFVWLLKDLYQGMVIVFLTLFLTSAINSEFIAVAYTSLILTEFFNIATEIHKPHIWMILSFFISLGMFVGFIFAFPSLFELSVFSTGLFFYKTALVVLVSCVPIFVLKIVLRRINPVAQTKVDLS